MGFDFSSTERRRLGYQLIDRIDQYFSSLKDLPVQLPLERRSFAALADAMPELPADAARVLDDICSELIENGFHVPSANYFGLMNPTPTYMAVLAEALVAALNPQLASLARSQLASRIESETVRWIAARVGWCKEVASAEECAGPERCCDGTFTSGGNEANFTALALALNAAFPAVLEDGVAAIGERPVLYASAEAHHSLDKSTGLLGLGRRALRRIPVNQDVQLDLAVLEARIKSDLAAGFRPFCVVGTAGTTNSGAIDDLPALAAIARRYDLWFHVDGAYGAAAIFSDRHRHLVSGLELADSVALDPHKWLAMPFAAGVVLTSQPDLLRKTFEVATPYMPRAAGARQLDNFKVSTQWSRRMNSLKLWLTLRVHGRQAYEEMIDRQLELAAKMAEWIASSEHFELAAPHPLPILNFRLQNCASEKDAEAAHTALVEEATRDGQLWFSHTHVNGRSVLRMMVISYLTDEHNLTQLQGTLTRAARSVLAGAAHRK